MMHAQTHTVNWTKIPDPLPEGQKNPQKCTTTYYDAKCGRNHLLLPRLE